MKKYSTELKFEIVSYYLSGNGSLRETAEKYGTNRGDVQKWVAAYRQHGMEGLSTKVRTYSGDFKLNVVKYMNKTGCSARQTAAYFNIPSFNTVCTWKRIYFEKGAIALFQNRRGRSESMSIEKTKIPKDKNSIEEDLVAEVNRLRMENEYLKKLNALVQKKKKLQTKTKHK